MSTSLKIALLLLFTLASPAVYAQLDTGYTPAKQYAVAQLTADFVVLKAALTEAHPSLYRFQSKETMDAAFKTAANKINHSMTEDEFWRVVQPVVVSIHSGHTGMYASTAQTNWYNQHPANLLPYLFHAQGEDIFIKSRKKGDSVDRVFKVVSIEGRSSSAIVDTLKKYVSGEGLSNQFVYLQLQRGEFSVVYGKVFGYRPSYAFTIIDSAGNEKKQTVKAVSARGFITADRFEQFLEGEKNELKKAVAINYPPDIPSTAILTIKGFTYTNYYKSFHYEFFSTIQKDKIKNLVIDLRGNGGGNANIGVDLMRYLVTGMVTQTEGRERPGRKTTFDDYIVTSANTSPMPDDSKFWQERVYAYSLNFDGNVYLLTDKATFSAASIFAASLKAERKITIIGEETGGGEAGTEGGYFTIVKLPNTGLLLRLPRFRMFTATSNRKSTHGVMPDVPVTDDIVQNANTDLVIKKLKELILSNNGKK